MYRHLTCSLQAKKLDCKFVQYLYDTIVEGKNYFCNVSYISINILIPNYLLSRNYIRRANFDSSVED